MQLVILAGGKGTRLKDRLGDLPKPMVDIAGQPLLEHQIRLARSHGFNDILLLLSYNADAIRSYFGDGERWGVRIHYLEDSVPLGTAGAVLEAIDHLAERFVIMYGDTMLNVDLSRFWNTHVQAGAAVSLFLHPNDHPQDSDLVEIDETSGRVLAFHPYPHPPDRYYANLVNAALYVMDRSALQPWLSWRGRSSDFGKHLFPAMLAAGATLHGYSSPEYIKDTGTPQRLDKVAADYRSGRIQAGSFETPAPAVFLDRDGTLNREVNRVKSPDELEVLPGAAIAVRRLNQAGYRTVVVTNQPVIARGDCTPQQLKDIHNKLETILGAEGAFLDAIYYCPHHPHKGYPGERAELKIACDCRKPAAGLIHRAVQDLNLDLKRSWMVGDALADVQAARNAGLPSILLGAAAPEGETPDYLCPDLGAAADLILGAARKTSS